MSALVPACTVGAASERFDAVPAARVWRGSPALELSTDGCALVPHRGRSPALEAISDGNRSVIVPDVRARFGGREWMLSVKGVGASTPAYDAFPDEDAERAGVLAARVVTGECWMGDSPYGGQGQAGAMDALAISALADERSSIAGVYVCPTIAVVELPEERVRRDCYWYRRHRGAVLQEHRLVPSDVRLFHGTEGALGRDAERALAGLGVEHVEALDAFAERYLASGVAALTLWARTARERDGAIEGLEYDDVWLDKDSILAADGTLFLVDLESLEWTPATHRMGIERRVRRQIDRNYYELLYGLDAILDVRDRWLDRAPDRRARRESVAARLALALEPDPYVTVIDTADGVDLAVRAPGDPIVVRFLDRR